VTKLQMVATELAKPVVESGPAQVDPETGAPLGSFNEEVQAQQVGKIQQEISDAESRLLKAREDEVNLFEQVMLENAKRVDTTEWMMAMQGVLWPGIEADCDLGRPLIPPATPPADIYTTEIETTIQQFMASAAAANAAFVPPATTTTTTTATGAIINATAGAGAGGAAASVPARVTTAVTAVAVSTSSNASTAESAQDDQGDEPPSSAIYAFYSPVPSGPGQELLSPGIINAARAASILEIDKIDDVVTIIDCFRWMSWCALTLHALRIPPPTHILRKLSDAAKTLKLTDDKITRSINGMLLRAT
jgi:hypothetical protein